MGFDPDITPAIGALNQFYPYFYRRPHGNMPICSTQLQNISMYVLTTQRGKKEKCLLRSSIVSLLGLRNISLWLAIWILTKTVYDAFIAQ